MLTFHEIYISISFTFCGLKPMLHMKLFSLYYDCIIQSNVHNLVIGIMENCFYPTLLRMSSRVIPFLVTGAVVVIVVGVGLVGVASGSQTILPPQELQRTFLPLDAKFHLFDRALHFLLLLQ